MPAKESLEQREARYGQRMIEIKVRFWTNDIADQKGMIIPKHAWCSGVVRLQSNKSHGIKPEKPIPFHSLLDIPSAIEKALVAHGIKLHVPRRMKSYMAE